MLGGSLEVRIENILYQLIEGQIRYIKTQLIDPALHSDSKTTFKHAPQVETDYWYSVQNYQRKIIGDQLLMKSHWVKG